KHELAASTSQLTSQLLVLDQPPKIPREALGTCVDNRTSSDRLGPARLRGDRVQVRHHRPADRHSLEREHCVTGEKLVSDDIGITNCLTDLPVGPSLGQLQVDGQALVMQFRDRALEVLGSLDMAVV